MLKHEKNLYLIVGIPKIIIIFAPSKVGNEPIHIIQSKTKANLQKHYKHLNIKNYGIRNW